MYYLVCYDGDGTIYTTDSFSYFIYQYKYNYPYIFFLFLLLYIQCNMAYAISIELVFIIVFIVFKIQVKYPEVHNLQGKKCTFKKWTMLKKKAIYL